MEAVWFFILCFMFIMYVLLDGFDFGAGIIHLFFAKEEEDKKVIRKAIGPFWDANEVWLIAGGGVMFVAFPVLYASAFSGFYLPLILVLWLIILRALGLELRGFVNHSMWHQLWDFLFGWSSFFLALFYGLALGNIVRGVNLGGMELGEHLYATNYFFLPLWNSTFSPFAERLGVVDWFTLQLGIIALLALSIHGAAWIIFKTETNLKERLYKVISYGGVALLLLSVIALFTWQWVRPDALQNYQKTPWLWVFPIFMFVGGVGLVLVKRFSADYMPFLFSCLFIASGLIATAVSMYPILLPSTNPLHDHMTVFNAGLDSSGVRIALSWFVLGIALVFAYFFFLFRIFKGKLDTISYGEH